MQHVKILLKKINTLNDSLSLDGGSVASIERDLMLSYIRQLYEAYLNMPPNGTVRSSASGNTTAKERYAGDDRSNEREITAPPKAEENIPEPPVRKYTPPKIIEIPDSKPAAPRPSSSASSTTSERSGSTHAGATTTRPNRTVDPKIKELFDLREAKELSEKLSLQPIKDLTKALSINDRLLYTNDLYNKETDTFNAALRDLNGAADMEAARALLEQQAAQYGWQDKEKADTAREFIKLVRRRHI